MKVHAHPKTKSYHGDLDIMRSYLQPVHYIVDKRQSLLEVLRFHRSRLVKDEQDVYEVVLTFPGLGVFGDRDRRTRIRN